ncbi:hypothetical protein KFK09_004962 [Dendrobium nobile]|uniref:Uncharacterized protein n=1 Tax=Dendrobium nobile TaxID=94219 RepID=A0A8T3BWW9_DENNO|nr:hypothetical protein KFK09_004962 [Dendrobium nobile]
MLNASVPIWHIKPSRQRARNFQKAIGTEKRRRGDLRAEGEKRFPFSEILQCSFQIEPRG